MMAARITYSAVIPLAPEPRFLRVPVRSFHTISVMKTITRALREIQFEVPETEATNRQDELGWPIFATEDSKEGMKAFKEKRKAVYKGS